MSEERILRLTFDEFETLGGFLEQPCKLTIVRKIASLRWEDLERTPRPEKEIREFFKSYFGKMQSPDDIMTFCFPYLSEVKNEKSTSP